MITEDKSLLKQVKFIDLFAGIGGFHLALSAYGATCVFASEWDKYAAETYKENFGIQPKGDITKITVEDIPYHDILCGGFPCQAFSISGKQRGFEDTRGTLFFDIARIINYHHPKVLFLENVKNLLKHDNGQTINIIKETLHELGYSVFYKILNSSQFGLPQNRERLYIVAFHNALNISEFQFPEPKNHPICLEHLLEKNPQNAKIIERSDIEIYKDYSVEDTLFPELGFLNKPIQIGKVNKGGQGERIYHPLGHAITLSAYGGGVGAKTGLYLIEGKIRKLSPRECARIQGFPESFIINSSISQAYKQFGNSVSVNVLQYIAKEIAIKLDNHNRQTKENIKIEYA
ncbi:MAG TPA: DNA cytosine methyltransferase [Edaphocola sp.]|nr:DNA cytosine methyltransferase [Edaphocola sp.]